MHCCIIIVVYVYHIVICYDPYQMARLCRNCLQNIPFNLLILLEGLNAQKVITTMFKCAATMFKCAGPMLHLWDHPMEHKCPCMSSCSTSKCSGNQLEYLGEVISRKGNIRGARVPFFTR